MVNFLSEHHDHHFDDRLSRGKKRQKTKKRKKTLVNFECILVGGDYKKKKDAVFKNKADKAQNILKEMQEHSKRCSVFE